MVQTMGTAESLPQHLLLLCLQLFLSLILTSLLHCSCTGVIASSEICYPRTVVSVGAGHSLVQQWVCPGASEPWLCWTSGNLLTASQKPPL